MAIQTTSNVLDNLIVKTARCNRFKSLKKRRQHVIRQIINRHFGGDESYLQLTSLDKLNCPADKQY